MSDKQILLIAVAPYLTLAAYDGWLHEKARRVPRPENALHVCMALSMIVLLAGLFLAQRSLVLPSLVTFVIASAIDEFGYHRDLPKHERRLHFLAFACFAVFIGVAVSIGAISWT